MNSKYIFRSMIAVAILGMASCKPELSDISPSKGTADFSRYIAIGNSLTSGYADNGLYLEGQKNSFPEMIAGQMKSVGGGAFYTPFFKDSEADGSGYKILTGFTAAGLPIIGDQNAHTAYRTTTPPKLFTKYVGEINNYGVPGIKLAHINIPQYGNLNNYFERMLPTDYPNNNNTTYLNFVTAKPFTFFSMWLGNNDILGYATTGGADPTDQPTPKAAFASLYTAAADVMTKDKAKGVVATIPDVLATPFFNTVTLSSLLAAVHATAPTINALYIKTGQNATRAATAKDYFVLPLASANLIGTGAIPYGLSPFNPIESQWVLDQDEAAIVADYVSAYNNTIKSVAASKGLAVVDAYALLKEYGAGKVVNGVPISAAYITGNLFSLDGIHLTPMGYALVANEFIRAINGKYGSSIPVVDVTRYRGVKFP
ncbi:SGNH/GDSL hydrolase family protein [Pedobacter gandavensis]|uniref:G-D-S-L family lipolytic protein n=1 Tax=Pedobacter gandavensis TaxID=2679963 RepID=A0ABR6EWN9_9SPHI|nr:SGNH/GDSL hydrolase family protein [Pedobacter gandavensis]MBB2149672.1 G-D-S-L family lipolytic protein [Pedobacter gandavensis]